MEHVALHQAVRHLGSGLQPGAVGSGCTRVLHHQGGVKVVEVAVGVPVRIQVNGTVEQRDHGQRQDGQLGQQTAGHALEFGAGQPQDSHLATSVSSSVSWSSRPGEDSAECLPAGASGAGSGAGSVAGSGASLPMWATGPSHGAGTALTAATTASGRPASYA